MQMDLFRREVFEMLAGLQYPDYYGRNDLEQEDDVPGENSNESGNEGICTETMTDS